VLSIILEHVSDIIISTPSKRVRKTIIRDTQNFSLVCESFYNFIYLWYSLLFTSAYVLALTVSSKGRSSL